MEKVLSRSKSAIKKETDSAYEKSRGDIRNHYTLYENAMKHRADITINNSRHFFLNQPCFLNQATKLARPA